MKKKNKIIIFIISFLIIIGLVFGVGLTYVVEVGLPYIRHENSLQSFYDYTMCYRCINANYSEEEMKNRLLNEMKGQHLTLDEIESMILESKEDTINDLNDLEKLYKATLSEKANDDSFRETDTEILEMIKFMKEKKYHIMTKSFQLFRS